ncbi:RING finger protein 215-like isoform X2 [Corticium candelabrum]|nr:RING finger protein 215-like isoform X2 [Corticium candelabrum]
MAKFCSGTATKPPLHRHGWVAAIILPSSESPACLRAPCTEKDDGNDNDDGKSASRLGKVSENREEREVCNLVAVASRALLWGAAAVLFLSEEVEVPAELNGEQQVHRPVVLLLANYAKKVAELLWRKARKSRVQIHPKTSSLWAGDISRVTLWTRCGPVRYHGTVCPGNYRHEKIPYMAMLMKTESALLLIGVVFIVFLVKVVRIRRQHLVQQEESLEVALANMARQAVNRMPTQRYKTLHVMRFTTYSRSQSTASKKPESSSRDSCAICLDEYSFRQVLRTLPCKHSFHRNCVDVWLISKRTCPLCKFNILDPGNSSGSDEQLNEQ